MKLLAFLLCIASSYVTVHLYLTNNIIALPMGMFTLLSYWLYYEVTKFTKT